MKVCHVCSVMQSDGNSFYGDVVLGWRQRFRSKTRKENMCVRIFNMMILILKKAYFHNSSTKTQFYDFLVVMCCISFSILFAKSLLRFKIFITKIQINLLLYICSKILSSYGYALWKLSKTTFPQKLFPSDFIKVFQSVICPVSQNICHIYDYFSCLKVIRRVRVN